MTVQSGRHQAAQATGGRKASRGKVSETAALERSSPDFVGRDDGLTAVVDALEHGPALVLVEGEAGIGKTRLVREALTAFQGHRSAGARTSDPRRVPVSADAQRILVAACPPLPEPFPLGPVVDGIRRLRPTVTQLGLSPLGGALRPLFPEWAELPPALESLDDPKETRHRAFSALTELMERLGVEVLVVEDAHWADSATLEWLLTLTAPGDLSVPIVVTYRPTDAPEGSLLPRLTSRPATDVAQVRVELEPLDVEQARRLVASMLGTEEVSEEFAEFLYERTDGVPLALEETVRLMRDRHDIIRRGGKWSRRVLDELDVPPTVRDSVLERVERLDPPARAVLEAAAVLAAPSDEQLLGAVAGLDADASQAGLAEALRSGLLQETDPGRFVFRHVLDAQAVGEAIPVSRQRHLHARAAEALKQRDPEPVARLARHFREANDVEAWCHYAEAAADLAWESGHDRTAVVTLLDVLTTTEHPLQRRVRLARKLGEAAFFGATALGDLAERVVRILHETLSSDDLPRIQRGELRLLLGRLLWGTGEQLATFEELEAAIPDLDDRPELAIRAMINLIMPLHPSWPAARHLQWLDRATELLPHVDSCLAGLALMNKRATVQLLLGEEEGWRAVDELNNAADTALDSSEQRRIAAGLLDVVWGMLAWGRHDDARRQLDAAVAYLQKVNYQRLMIPARVERAYLDWYTGTWRGLRETAAELVEAEPTELLDQLHAQQILGLLDLVSGARNAADRRLRAVSHQYARRGMTEPVNLLAPAALGRARIAAGAADEALQETAPVMDMIARKGVWLWATDIASVHMEALIGLGRVDDAKAAISQFTKGIGDKDAPVPAAALLVCRGLMAEARGDLAQAVAQFAEAAQAWGAVPRPYDELLALERRGRCLLAVGKREEALTVLSESEQRLRDLGAKWDADRVAHLLRQHGVEVSRAWKRGRRGYGDQLSPRELEIVELVAQGMTNKQVAETLYISPRTVGQHLASAMHKLNVSSRTALAVAASETGLLSSEVDREA